MLKRWSLHTRNPDSVWFFQILIIPRDKDHPKKLRIMKTSNMFNSPVWRLLRFLISPIYSSYFLVGGETPICRNFLSGKGFQSWDLTPLEAPKFHPLRHLAMKWKKQILIPSIYGIFAYMDGWSVWFLQVNIRHMDGMELIAIVFQPLKHILTVFVRAAKFQGKNESLKQIAATSTD